MPAARATAAHPPTGLIVAVDGLDAGPGDRVIVAHGSRVRDLTVGEDVADKDVDRRHRRRAGSAAMILGRVVGQVWATRRDPRLARAKLLVVRPHGIYEPALGTRHLVATDDVHAGIGDEVVVCLGMPARQSLGSNDTPVDAAILGVVDRIELDDASPAGCRRRTGHSPPAVGGGRDPSTPGWADDSRDGAGPGLGDAAVARPRRAQAGAGRRARRERRRDGPGGRRRRHAGRARGRGRHRRVRFGRAQRAASRAPNNRDLLCDAAVAAIVEGAG